jgi:hypothetical protein
VIAALLGAARVSTILAAILAAAPVAGARAAGAPSVAVTGSCPTAEALTAALSAALGDETRRRDAAPRVADLGAAFEVAALGQRQRYSDPARDCAERARVAAVFIAMTLNPPDLPAPPPRAPPPPPPPTIAAAPPPPETARGGWAELGAAGRVDGGATVRGGAVGYAAGLELRVAAGRRAWGVAATAGILTPLESEIGSVSVRERRYPLSLSLLGRHVLSASTAISAAAGLALVPFTLRGEGLATSVPATRVDAGVRLAGALEVLVGRRLVSFVELHADYFPRGYDLAIDPAGTIGSTGRLWVGASLGLAFATGAR